MRTIDFLPRDANKCIETLDVYGPIAIRIGMQNREELEDRAFKCLHPMRARLKSAIKMP